ncbi:hypothetical protein NWQ33_04070 [Mycoplasmopsis cynos]|nr:hypothetical protein [Mycoplasmopsis cynos]
MLNQNQNNPGITSTKLKDDVICLFIDYLNFNFVLKNIKENNTEILKHYSKKQLSYWLSYWQKGVKYDWQKN